MWGETWPASRKLICWGNSTLGFCAPDWFMFVYVTDAWTFTVSGTSSRIERAVDMPELSSEMILSSAAVVNALSLNSRPVGVSSGNDRWHALHVRPVCRAKLDSA